MANKKATEDLMGELHGMLAEEMLNRIRSGKASPSDLNAARQFLKDNNITVANPGKSKPLRDLAESMPFDDIETDAPLKFATGE